MSDEDDDEDTFPEWDGPLKKHLEQVKSRKSSNTLKNRQVAMGQWRDYCESEGTTILDASTVNLDDWLDHLNNEGYAGKSILNKFYDISALYKFLRRRTDDDGVAYIDEDFIEEMKKIDLSWLNTDPEINEHLDARYLEFDEFEQLLDGCNTLRESVLIRFLWETGARAVEASRTRITDFSRDDQTVTLRTAKQGEGNYEERDVYYRRKLERLLKEWIDRGGRNRYMGAENSPFLFVTKESPMMSAQRIGEVVHDVAVRAGLNDKVTFFDEDEMREVELTTADGRPRYEFSTHCLRHSYAVHRTKNGMPIVYLQRLLGHSDIEQTRFYLEFRDDDVEKADRNYAPTV